MSNIQTINFKKDVFMGCECPDAEIIMFSAPFDSTTSFRPGARFAGKAIRENSYGIESYSPYQEKDLFDLKIMDAGCLELPMGNTPRALEQIEAQTAQILDANAFGKNIYSKPFMIGGEHLPCKPFMIGGEHLTTLGAVRAMAKKFPDLHILHFDAHADLRDNYLGEFLSHATVMRRCWEIVGDKRIYQLGIRSGDADEFQFAAVRTTMSKFNLARMENYVRALEGKPVYFSLDLDVLDPSVFPGTGTPEPGGVTFHELHNAILMLKNLNIVGCDVVELSPHYDPSGVSTITACKIIREILMVM